MNKENRLILELCKGKSAKKETLNELMQDGTVQEIIDKYISAE